MPANSYMLTPPIKKLTELVIPHEHGDQVDGIQLVRDDRDRDEVSGRFENHSETEILEAYNELGRADHITYFKILVSWCCAAGDDAPLLTMHPILFSDREREMLAEYYEFRTMFDGPPPLGNLTMIEAGLLNECYIPEKIFRAFAKDHIQAAHIFVSQRKRKLIKEYGRKLSLLNEPTGTMEDATSITTMLQDLVGASFDSRLEGHVVTDTARRTLKSIVEKEKKNFRICLPDFSPQHTVQSGELCVLAARPGSGKTTVLVHQAIDYMKQGYRVLYVSVEEDIDSLSNRFIATVSNYDLARLRIPETSLEHYAESRKAIMKWKEFLSECEGKLFIPEHRIANPQQLSAEIGKHLPDVVMVDSVYLMDPSNTQERRHGHEKYANVIQEISVMTKNFGVAMFVSTQMNRVGAGDTPKLEHIAYSDAYGQEAALAIALVEATGFVKANIIKSRFNLGKQEIIFKIDFKTSQLFSETDWKSEETMKRIAKPVTYDTMSTEDDKEYEKDEIEALQRLMRISRPRIGASFDARKMMISQWKTTAQAKRRKGDIEFIEQAEKDMELDPHCGTIEDYPIHIPMARITRISHFRSNSLVENEETYEIGLTPKVLKTLSTVPLLGEEFKTFINHEAQLEWAESKSK